MSEMRTAHLNQMPVAPPLGPSIGDSHMPAVTATADDSAFSLRIKPDRRCTVTTIPPSLERRGPGA